LSFVTFNGVILLFAEFAGVPDGRPLFGVNQRRLADILFTTLYRR